MTERIAICKLCPNRVCEANFAYGKIIKDEDKLPKVSLEDIEDCVLRDSLEVEDNKLELGS